MIYPGPDKITGGQLPLLGGWFVVVTVLWLIVVFKLLVVATLVVVTSARDNTRIIFFYISRHAEGIFAPWTRQGGKGSSRIIIIKGKTMATETKENGWRSTRANTPCLADILELIIKASLSVLW